MSEEMVRTAEPEPEGAPSNGYEVVFQARAAYTHRQHHAPLVIHAKDRGFERTRQGLLQFFLQPQYFPEQCLGDWWVTIQDIPRASGRHTHQGGLVIFIISGRGYTVIDGVRHDWKAGDLVVLPMKPNGVEHQHFNLDPDKPSRWLAFISEYVHNHTGSIVKQQDLSPEYRPGVH
jgi:mannose-6-phosphate isomerase-like protein (cupin superfamily)